MLCYGYPMGFQGMGFVTHHEIESLLGGGSAGVRQRARLTDRGWLPKAPFIRADRYSVAIYPEFCLSALAVSGRASRSLRHPIEVAAEKAVRLFDSNAYRAFRPCLAEALRHVDSEDAAGLVWRAAELDYGVFSGWRDEVLDCSESLVPLGLELEALAAKVAEVGNVYVIELGGQLERHPIEAAPQQLELGALVTRDRVKVLSTGHDFLLPVPDMLPLEMSQAATSSDEAEFARMLFEGLEDEIRVLPQLGAAREAVDAGGLTIDMPWHLLQGGNSMSRRSPHVA